jgi:hypothetical protein
MPAPSFAVSEGDTRRYLFFALCMSVVLITVGTLVLVGWSFDIALLKSVLPGLATMKPNTAICFILRGSLSGGLLDPKTWMQNGKGWHRLAL